jgi:hypothetical protein
MHKLTTILVALALGSTCALAQVVGTAGTAAGSGSACPSGTAGQGAPESKGSAGSAGTMGRQIGTLPRVTTTHTPGMVGQLSVGASSPTPNLPLVQNSPATMGALGIHTPGMVPSPFTRGTFAPGVIAVPRP